MSIPCFQTSSDAIIKAALDEVGPQENGNLINDHYSRSFYISRRVGFLGKLPEYSRRRNGLFDLVHLDADAVFTGDIRYRGISVQEVRRREILNEIVPFLPLPTTENMPSEDDYAGLPDSDLAEEKPAAPRTFVASPPPEPIVAPPSPEPSAGPVSPLEDSVEQLRAAAKASRPSETIALSAGRTLVAAAAAASYAGRSTQQPIKYKRGTKRPLLGPNETAEPVSSDSEAVEGLTDLEDDTPKPKRRRKAPKSTDTAAHYKESRPTTQPVSKSTKKNKSIDSPIDAIVSGKILPKSRAQAKQANEARYQLLVRAHNAARKKQKRKKSLKPELMPEYFQTSNFGDEQERLNQVRCVCGVLVDDGLSMVCCDECDVWQHVNCVHDAAKPADVEKERYACHNCDPWAHRRKIQGMRRANLVNV